ncbi:MAG: ribonuclease HI family protein [Candidatus Omnitrophota bacterium]
MPKTDLLKKIEIFSDGASRGNPGPAGVGAVLFDDKGQKIGEVSEYIGEATNNAAEYTAVICALTEAIRLKGEVITLNLDSQLVARHLKGKYKVKNSNIKKLFIIARDLLRCFKKVDIVEVGREKNEEADKLANKALDFNALL